MVKLITEKPRSTIIDYAYKVEVKTINLHEQNGLIELKNKNKIIEKQKLFWIILLLIFLWGPPIFQNDQISVSYTTINVNTKGLLIGLAVSCLGILIGYFVCLKLILYKKFYTKLLENKIFLCYFLLSILFILSSAYANYRIYSVYKSLGNIAIFFILFNYIFFYQKKWYELFLLILIFYILNGFHNIIFDLINSKEVTMGNIDGGRLIGGNYFVKDYGFAGYLIYLMGMSIFLYTSKFKNYFIATLSILFGGYLLIRSGTRSYLIPAVLYPVIIITLHLFFGKVKIKFILLLFVMGSIFILFFNQIVAILLRNFDSIESLFGRLEIWKIYLNYFRKSPFIGFGYASASRYISIMESTKTGAHNGWIQLMVSNGILGVLFYIILLIQLLKIILSISPLVIKSLSLPLLDKIIFSMSSYLMLFWIISPPMSDNLSGKLNSLIIIFVLVSAQNKLMNIRIERKGYH